MALSMRKRRHPPPARFARRTIDELTIEDEESFRHVSLYADLKEVLRRANYTFRVLPRARRERADRALLLNLTFWSAEEGGDVLADERVPADVVAHAAWHHLAARALAAPGTPLAVEALFLGEAIASAFDVYLIGRLLGHAPRSTFLSTQVPAMAATADAAGLSAAGFETLLLGLAAAPERAFADLRELLSDATAALFASEGSEEALAALAAFDGRPLSPLLHRYELSNWVLYARAAPGSAGADRRARTTDRALRRAKSPLDWLVSNWISKRNSPETPTAPSATPPLEPSPTGERSTRARAPRPDDACGRAPVGRRRHGGVLRGCPANEPQRPR
jgi:hypothetical protein